MASKTSFYNSTGVTNTQSNAIDASVSNAEASATASANSAVSSATKANESSTSATASSVSANASEVSRQASGVSAVASEVSRQASLTKANEVAAFQQEAITKAGEASASATAAANSAASITGAETNAANSATAASASKDAALAALDNFDDRYLGVKSSNPSVDNDLNALVAGSLYFNSTDNIMKVYEGSTWVAAYASLSGALIAANNLSDLGNASTARTSLGLGTAATTAATAYATAAQGTLATNALPKAGGTMTGNLNIDSSSLKVRSTSGSTLELTNTSTTLGDNAFVGGLAFRNDDTSGSEPHYAGIKARTDGSGGTEMDLEFYANRDKYETDDPHMILRSTGDLHLSGDANIDGTAKAHKIEIGNGSAGGTSEILFSDNASGRGKIKYNHGSTPEVLTLETTGTIGLSMDNSQNVSIPNGNLNVGNSSIGSNSSHLANLTINNNGNIGSAHNTSAIQIVTGGDVKFNQKVVANSSSSGDYVRMYGGSGTGKWDIYGSGGNLRFSDNDSAGSVQFDTSVGIGTNDPKRKLHLSQGGALSTGNDYDVAIFQNSDAAGIRLVDAGNGGNNGGNAGLGNDNGNLNVASAGMMTFSTNLAANAPLYGGSSNSDGGTERLRITDAGRVGIGDDSPSAKLEIGGMSAGEQGFLIQSGRNDALSNGLARINITDANSPFAGLQIDHAGTGAALVANGNITVTGTINGGDCRGTVSNIGLDTNDCINVFSTVIDFKLDNNLDMRLENDGDLHVDGNVVAYSTTTSDERLKKDIVKIDNALDKILQLNGYTFEYLADGKKSAGVIAQEVEKVMPSAVSETTLPVKMGDDDTTEYKVVQYDQLHGLMIEAIKELSAEIEELKYGSTK